MQTLTSNPFVPYPKGLRKKSWWSIFWILIIFLVSQIGGGLIGQFAYPFLHPDSSFNLKDVECQKFFGYVLAFVNLLMIALFWGFKLIRRRPFHTTHPNGSRFWPLALIAFIFIAFGINFLLAPFDLTNETLEQMFGGITQNWIGILAVAVLGPIAEECMLREGILRHMIKGGLSIPLAILLSSLLFGMIHGNISQAIPATVMGIFLGVFYVRMGDMRLSIAAHILNNSLALYIDEKFMQPYIEQYSTLIGFTFLFIGLALVLTWQRSNSNSSPNSIS